MELAFVLATRQNVFFHELAEVLMDELAGLGVAASLHLDWFPDQGPGRVNVLLPPHEFFALRRHRLPPELAPLERTLLVCGEQPGTEFFRQNVELSARGGAVFDINPGSVAEMQIHGVPARPLPLGWTRRWDGTPLDGVRDIDVCFLGCHSERRARALASYAPLLARRRCHLLVSDNSRPNDAGSRNFVAGEDRRALLRRSKVLLNLHHDELPYFEWLRALQAVLCGAVLVSEHSTHTEPLVLGRHYAGASIGSLGMVADALLDDPDRLAAMRDDAYAALRRRPMSEAAAQLAEAAERVGRAARRPPATEVALPEEPVPDWLDPPYVPRDVTADEDASVIRRAVKDLKLELIDLRRDVERLLSAPQRSVSIEAATPAWESAAPRVSIVVSSYGYEALITRALDSAAASSYDSIELVVVDDASRDASVERARDWLDAHPEVPALLLRHAVNRGLGQTRNTALGVARGELVFTLDADNELYPHGLARLVAALDDDPDADFAYGILGQFTADGPFGLMGLRAWHPEQLRVENYIDAMALVRASTLRELGGYSTNPKLHGFEDWNLWCGVAERGGRGVMVREIVARYRVAKHSMSSATSSVSLTDAFAVLAELHPSLMGDVRPPL